MLFKSALENTYLKKLLEWCYFKIKKKKVVENPESELPLRSELFSADQMAEHGKHLANTHRISSKTKPDKLLNRLAENEQMLMKTCRILTHTANVNNRVTPAGEWLLDNFYLIEEQIRLAKLHLPKGYGKSLPQLESTFSKGYPRVYDLALQIIAHGDGHWNIDNLNRCVTAYQSVSVLSLGELWAIPIMLRMALIENLRRVSTQIAANQLDCNLAAGWAEQLTKVVESTPKNLILTVADMARSDPPMMGAFVAELVRALQGQGTALSLPLTWIEQQLSENGHTLQQLIQAENQQQAAHQLSVSNSIASLRRLGEVDWRKFVEMMSVVDHALQQDPTDAYRKMDFATCDRYRHAIERLARRSGKTEQSVAATAIQLAQSAQTARLAEVRQQHVGFYLIDEGQSTLKSLLGVKINFKEKLLQYTRQYALGCYLSIILLMISGVSILVEVEMNTPVRHFNFILLAVFLFAVIISASQLALAVMTWCATLKIKPCALPKMDFSKNIPPSCQTLIVVPAMLKNITGIHALVEALEVRFLGNRQENLYFALLTDFADALQENCAQDTALLSEACEQIEILNKRYSAHFPNKFYLFHRPRRWNPQEHCWMGHERKRGKLNDLNLLLRGNSEGFLHILGNIELLRAVKYVITLDTDTQLPHGTACQLIGAMAHPLNKPYYDPNKQRVTRGYGILQPRISEALTSMPVTQYSRLFSNACGIDPYTRTVSDIYQDLFKEGSFIGKGIYDVDIFQMSVRQFPDNTILSHDLLEGCYCRSGLISDVSLYEQSPESYLIDAQRRHRWIRGDWQLIRWLFPFVLNKELKRMRNPLSALSIWKILDNLRRSLVPLSFVLLIFFGWIIFPFSNFFLYTVLFILALPSFASIIIEFTRQFRGISVQRYLAALLTTLGLRLTQITVYFASLPHEALYNVDAISRTVWRVFFSHQRLLEWKPYDETIKESQRTSFQWKMTLGISPIAGMVFALYLYFSPSAMLLPGTVFCGLWIIFPFIAWFLSRPVRQAPVSLRLEQIHFLRMTARKTWHFFETFMTEKDHWLPPDNYQEAPVEILAHRTSPTNIGLALLSNLTAYDFGYLSMSQLLERTRQTLNTLAALERYRGHFYNWYDTQSLQPLQPRYISTVDSGNLAGHLLTLRQGLLSLPEECLLNKRCFEGVTDTFEVLILLLPASANALADQFLQCLKQTKILFLPSSPLDQLILQINNLQKLAEQLANQSSQEWGQKLVDQCREINNDAKLLAIFYPMEGVFKNIDCLTVRSVIKLSVNSKNLNAQQMTSITQIQARLDLIETLVSEVLALAEMDYDFLYDQNSHLMTIGFNVDEMRADRSNYDLLASEIRLGNFVAVAQGKIPEKSWFSLGRLLVLSEGKPLLVSWSGTMFEYLMPLIIMPSYQNTLLDQTYKTAVKRQIHYAQERGVPWGISESCFNAVDANSNYQYRAFGVPGLGLMRGLSEDLVIAPYASLLALMVLPAAACANLQLLADKGAFGQFGFYEAIDFTPSRLPSGKTNVLIRVFMAHHLGMSFTALSAFLHHHPLQRRFEAEPMFKAALLLLQEKLPKMIAAYPLLPPSLRINKPSDPAKTPNRSLDTPHTPIPEIQLLSNGHYQVMLSQAGSGFSRWKGLAITRWREDGISDNTGIFTYLCDVDTGNFWSTCYQPVCHPETDRFRVIFSEGHAQFSQRTAQIDSHMEVVVSPEDDIELRRLRIHNRSLHSRSLELTSYGEIVLAPQAADQEHPAFSNLFIQTEIIPQKNAILATRRSLDKNAQFPWMFHLLTRHHDQSVEISYETDRAKFIGRGRSLNSPLAMVNTGRLSDTAGAVLDPIAAIRCRILIEAGKSMTFDLVTGIAETRAQCIALIEKYTDPRLASRVFGLVWTHSQVFLRQLNISQADAQLYTKIASAIIYAAAHRRTKPEIIAGNVQGQSGLWGYSISGDLPIVVVHIEDTANMHLVQQLIQAHAYWRQKNLAVDLVILNDEAAGYRQALQDQVTSLMTPGITLNVTDQAGGIFVRAVEQMPAEDLVLLHSAARIILFDRHGSLEEQWERRVVRLPAAPRLKITKKSRAKNLQPICLTMPDLIFFNETGGFTTDGQEYVITLGEGKTTPAPWVNVLANPFFGSVVSESGQAYTWTENAHEFRLTPWHNDAVQDAGGETFYLRNEKTGYFWSAAALPCRGKGDYQTRHGFGYSLFLHHEENIYTELCQYTALDAPIKFFVLKVRNDAAQSCRLSAIGYIEWVLGSVRSKTAMHIVTEIADNGSILAKNPYNTDMGGRTAFFNATMSKLNPTIQTVTGDRKEFIGRNRTLQRPAALHRTRLSGCVGAGLDPCAAIQLTFDLAQGQTREFVFTLGAGQNREEAEKLMRRFNGKAAAQDALRDVQQYWQRTLGKLQVKTPDPALNLLTNGWLLYQVLSSRLYGRSGYYQSGGAFGFRDQLQDVMCLVHAEPLKFRTHLLLCASRQFVQGDVQHWWHPPQGQGVRTRCSDDYLWLPFALCRYVEATGDTAVLAETVPFLQGRALNTGEESYYDLPKISTESASLYQHAVRAILHGLTFGSHGLPLMQAGDWNDGMNLVGINGQGESVWLGFFLYTVLKNFAPLAQQQNDPAFADRCTAEALKLQLQLELHGWDGEWYRRAYFDDGSLLGSVQNTECRLDSIAQSWSVLSEAASPDRAKKAMLALNKHLVREKERVIQLLDPPFNQSALNPGYIKGYLPGVRENGGQYTHGAVWAAMAFAKMGENALAWKLFNMINPINHSRTADENAVYKIEPYVLAADVYAIAPHMGRGGWSWYTGSAGWLYRLITESLLGLNLKNNILYLKPCLPKEWENFSLDYLYQETMYKINITRTSDSEELIVDGLLLKDKYIILINDQKTHEIKLKMKR